MLQLLLFSAPGPKQKAKKVKMCKSLWIKVERKAGRMGRMELNCKVGRPNVNSKGSSVAAHDVVSSFRAAAAKARKIGMSSSRLAILSF